MMFYRPFFFLASHVNNGGAWANVPNVSGFNLQSKKSKNIVLNTHTSCSQLEKQKFSSLKKKKYFLIMPFEFEKSTQHVIKAKNVLEIYV